MQQNTLETIIGFIVLAAAGLFISFAYHTNSNNNFKDSYILQANFQNIDGINVGSDVLLAGIKIGQVKSLSLNTETFYAAVQLIIDNNIKIPEDSQAAVSTSGFLGGKYINIVPGASDKDLSPNAQIKYTQSAINLESLISKLMYSLTNK